MTSPPHKHIKLYRFLVLFVLFFSSSSFFHFSFFPPPPPPPPCATLIIHGFPSGISKPDILCCDRTHFRSDVCYMLGDIRASSHSILAGATPASGPSEKIRPYTRKWEAAITAAVHELTLRRSQSSNSCHVRHTSPVVVFSTGGYTGNVYHEFNDGLIPLYITTERFAGEVVVAVVEYHEWWFEKYSRVLEKMSRHEIVDLGRDKRVHCFPEAIIGLKIHGELSIDSTLMPAGKNIHDFQSLLNSALTTDRHVSSAPFFPATSHPRPNLAIITRQRSRRLLNLQPILHLARRSGFNASLVNPKRSTPLAEIHRSLSTADAVIAVHGAAITHFLFMRPGSVLIQVVPLGVAWAAETYYGEPARRLGLKYMAYNVTAEESSLSKEYGKGDPVLVDTESVTRKGWAETKRVYLDGQDVELDLKRFKKVLRWAYHCLTNVIVR